MATDRKVICTAPPALGTRTGMLVNVLDPAAVGVGGRLGLSEGPYWDTLVPAIRRGIWAEQNPGLPIMQASVGTHACWVGAALAAVPYT